MGKLTIHVRSRAGIAFVTATAALALTACGGGAKRADDGKIDGAEGSASASADPASPSPSGGPGGDGVERPKITLPDDVKHVFEPRSTGDARQDAVLADNERNIISEDDAILRGDPRSTALSFYNTGSALAGAVDWVKKFLDADLTLTGTTRYYNRHVKLDGDKKATLTYCGDESKAFNKNRKTGKVDRDEPSKDSYVLYNTRLVKSDKGVWQTTEMLSWRGSDSCQP
ncbi:hypothetical protein B7P34_19950 [Streptosporangium nondiastaticum]|uniref:Lipoprotein n=1 Tax=Streptosporangium nondiastaticum TaxID=35764 RepID=A0A9X7JNN2_9ACTN|nr:hypothetical protein B7P34_19950 [Streptosporangium nondiastaticum]